MNAERSNSTLEAELFAQLLHNVEMFCLIWTPIWCGFVQLDTPAEIYVAAVVFVRPREAAELRVSLLLLLCLDVFTAPKCKLTALKMSWALFYKCGIIFTGLLENLFNWTVFSKGKMTPCLVWGLVFFCPGILAVGQMKLVCQSSQSASHSQQS